MPILNYTTKIDSGKTASEIMAILGKHGALSSSLLYEDFEPAGITFALNVQGQLFNYKLPLNWRGTLKAMSRDKKVPRSAQNDSQARRVAWRILKDWIAAQMAIIESDQAEMREVFLPYAINRDGQTLFEVMVSEPERLLAGKSEQRFLTA